MDSVGKEDTDLTNSSSRLKSEISYPKIKTDKSFFQTDIFKRIKIEKNGQISGFSRLTNIKSTMKYIRFAKKKTDIFFDAYSKVIINDSNGGLGTLHDILESQRLVQSIKLF